MSNHRQETGTQQQPRSRTSASQPSVTPVLYLKSERRCFSWHNPGREYVPASALLRKQFCNMRYKHHFKGVGLLLNSSRLDAACELVCLCVCVDSVFHDFDIAKLVDRVSSRSSTFAATKTTPRRAAEMSPSCVSKLFLFAALLQELATQPLIMTSELELESFGMKRSQLISGIHAWFNSIRLCIH